MNTVLALNAGSSSLKFAIFQKDSQLVSGNIENIGQKGQFFQSDFKDKKERKKISAPTHSEALLYLFKKLPELNSPSIDAIGHRIVHGGEKYIKPEKITSKLLTDLKKLIPFAPLHLPSEIAVIDACQKHFPHIPQVASFDTAFHRKMPKEAECFSLPMHFYKEGIKRYGFHGLSYEYILSELQAKKNEKIIIAHLGNGASMAAIHENNPIDTTMGFTPTGGFMMGTRTGDLDPGILLYLMRDKKMDADKIENLVDGQSGLLGISEMTSNMEELLQSKNPKASFAIELFCYQARKAIGALASALNGLTILVFTAGIGEKSSKIREKICEKLSFLNIYLDKDKNQKNEPVISKNNHSCKVLVMKTDEDKMIARHTYKTLR